MNVDTFKFVRYYLKLTQREFSDVIAVTYSTVAAIEAGERRITDNVQAKVAHVFDATDTDFQEFVIRNRQLSE